MKSKDNSLSVVLAEQKPTRIIIDINDSKRQPVSRQELVELCKRTQAHIGAKRVDPKLVEQAAINEPFGEYARFIRDSSTIDSAKIIEAVEQFLLGTYNHLKEAGISFSISGEHSVDSEQGAISELKRKFKDCGLSGQAVSLDDEYTRFCGARKCFGLMQKHDILRVDSILPMEYLPEIVMAAPVWFVDAREKLNDLTKVNDPKPDHACRYFCSQLPNQLGADLYQMYNRRTRPLGQFKGRDIMPASILELIPAARQSFDYVVVATPYHDQASTEWADPDWQRNLDPFLLGFMTGLPFIFMLGRWSSSGILPLFLDMVADTIDHLESHLEGLRNFDFPYWVYKDNRDELCDGEKITRSANKIIAAFRRGKLFEVLHESRAT